MFIKRVLAILWQQFVDRWYWIQQVVVTAIAAAASWQVGDLALKNGGVVAAIVSTLTVRSSLHKSTREGVGQVVGSSVGAGAALLALHFFGLGIITVGLTVLISLAAARLLHLGEVATINVPVTALIVIGPGLSETNAANRLNSTLIGAGISIVASIFAHPKTPAGRTIDRIVSLTERSAVLTSQMAEGLVDGFTSEDAGRWLARARLLVEEIPSIRNQAIEARVFAKWLPTVRSENAEKLYLRGIAIEHVIIQTRTTARALFDISITGVLERELRQEFAHLLSSVSFALSVDSESFKYDPYSASSAPTTSEIRMVAETLTNDVMHSAPPLDQVALTRAISVISSCLIIADSLDQLSPAIRTVPTPEGSAGQFVLSKSPRDFLKFNTKKKFNRPSHDHD